VCDVHAGLMESWRVEMSRAYREAVDSVVINHEENCDG
jgi:hypothetical protein